MSDKKETVRMTLNYSDFYWLNFAMENLIYTEGSVWEDYDEETMEHLKKCKAMLSRLVKNWKRIGYKEYVPPK